MSSFLLKFDTIERGMLGTGHDLLPELLGCNTATFAAVCTESFGALSHSDFTDLGAMLGTFRSEVVFVEQSGTFGAKLKIVKDISGRPKHVLAMVPVGKDKIRNGSEHHYELRLSFDDRWETAFLATQSQEPSQGQIAMLEAQDFVLAEATVCAPNEAASSPPV